MSRTVAPLLSFDARGQIAKTQVYSAWKGRQYVRRYVVPANPNTTEQQSTRNVFSWLQKVWKYIPGSATSAWEAYANTSRFTAINGWIKQNLAALRPDADLSGLIFSPAANGGLSAASATFTGGNDQVTIAAVPPTLPVGWTVTTMRCAVIRQQDPHSGTLYTVTAGSDASDPYSVVIAGLDSAQTYVCGAWFEYLKPNGETAYGQALMGTALTT